MTGGTLASPDLSKLQAALIPFAAAMELAAELNRRELESFLEITCTRVARESSRLAWWES